MLSDLKWNVNCDAKYLDGVQNFYQQFPTSGMSCILNHEREQMKYGMNICDIIGFF